MALAPGRPARAEGGASQPSTQPISGEALPLWEIGAYAVAADFAAYPGSNQNLSAVQVLPYAVYRGSVWRLENGGVGMRAMRTPRVEWDLSGSGAFGGRANDVHARSGMPAIGRLAEVGPAVRINVGDLVVPTHDPRRTWLELPVRAVFDVSGGVSRRGWAFEPRLSHTAWSNPSLALELSLGLLAGDRRLNNIFYGVPAAYAIPGRPAYEARGGLVATRIDASLRQRLSHTVHLRWFAEIETVRGAANAASPLVRTRFDGGAGVSLTWSLWRSSVNGVE